MRYTFIILGEPVAKGRPRMSRFGGIYTPKATKMAEANIRAQIAQQLPTNHVPLDCALRMTLYVVKLRPKSLKKSVLYPIGRSDIDNYIKLAMDALNGVVFVDDARVVELRASKTYGEVPRIEILLEEIQ